MRWHTACLVFAAWTLGMWSTGAAQPVVDRLEKQIRKEVEATKPPPANPATARPKAEKQPAEPAAANVPGERGYLGALTDDREDRGRGVRVLRVTPGSPADQAGLKSGDLITGLGGVRVREMEDFAAIMEDVTAGMTLTFEILRGQERPKVDVTFGSRPPAKGAPAVSAPSAPEREPPGVPPPPEPKATVAPKAIELEPATDDRARIRALEQKVRTLEARIEQLERALQDEEKGE
jgi:membrane-associated protease RseP (regulator of RpoE activity)